MKIESARLALLMYANAAGQVSTPSLNMDWKTIHTSASVVGTYCVSGQHSGGVWIISGINSVLLRRPLLSANDTPKHLERRLAMLRLMYYCLRYL